MWVRSLGQEDPLEEGIATHPSILAWRIPWTEEPGWLQAIGSQSWIRLKGLSTHMRSMQHRGDAGAPCRAAWVVCVIGVRGQQVGTPSIMAG